MLLSLLRNIFSIREDSIRIKKYVFGFLVEKVLRIEEYYKESHGNRHF